jgi:hypothetical protein
MTLEGRGNTYGGKIEEDCWMIWLLEQGSGHNEKNQQSQDIK